MPTLILLCCLINPLPDSDITNSIIINSFNDANVQAKPVCYVVSDDKECGATS